MVDTQQNEAQVAEDTLEESDSSLNNIGKSEELPRLSLSAQISALIFVSQRPVSAVTISEVLAVDLATVESELEKLRDFYDPLIFGFELVNIAEAWQFRSSALAANVITKLAPPKLRRLSKAASETLAVVAYKQPVGKAEIDSIRGVDSSPTLRTLLDLRLVRAVGKANAPGHPMLYGTTTIFLERFGLHDLTDLPSLKELEDLVQIDSVTDTAKADDDQADVEPGESVTASSVPL